MFCCVLLSVLSLIQLKTTSQRCTVRKEWKALKGEILSKLLMSSESMSLMVSDNAGIQDTHLQ